MTGGGIFYLLSIFSIISGILTIAQGKNPINSVVYLVLVFGNSALIFMLMGVDLIGLIYIIVYVGAIAILFIFVIMMMDLRLAPTGQSDNLRGVLTNSRSPEGLSLIRRAKEALRGGGYKGRAQLIQDAIRASASYTRPHWAIGHLGVSFPLILILGTSMMWGLSQIFLGASFLGTENLPSGSVQPWALVLDSGRFIINDFTTWEIAATRNIWDSLAIQNSMNNIIQSVGYLLYTDFLSLLLLSSLILLMVMISVITIII